MLTINSNEKKKLKFGISVAGVQARDLHGALRLTVEGVEYGFPVQIVEGNIEVEIPPLKNLLREVDNDRRYDVKLELIANDTYIVPWTDTARINTPISVEVSKNVYEEDEKVNEVKIGVTKVDEEIIKENDDQEKTAKCSRCGHEFIKDHPTQTVCPKCTQEKFNKKSEIKSRFRKMLEK